MFFLPLIVAILISFSALLAASETAIFSLLRMENLRDRLNQKTKRAVEELLVHPLEFLIVIGTLSESANVFAECLAAAWMLNLFGRRGALLTVPLMFAIVLLFAEITPKTLALAYPTAVASLTGRPLRRLTVLITPLVKKFLLTGDRIPAERISKTEFKILLKLGHDQGQVADEEREIIHRTLEFANRRVVDIMTPRSQIFAVSIDTPFEKLVEECTRGHFSRIPVYRGELDNIVGILNVKDLVVRRLESTPPRLERLLRRPRFVPASKRVGELFEEMRRDGVQLVLVVDEYGKLLGLVTMEDILEELFGEIRDEFDVQVPQLITFVGKEMLVSGSIDVAQLNQELKRRGFNTVGNGEPTLGRLIVHRLGRVPRRGEQLRLGDLTIIVEKVRGASVELVRIR